MKNKEIEEILNYMKQYVENKYEHDSEPMLNYKDLQIVLSYIEQLEKRNKELYEAFMATQEELTDYATKNEQLENNRDKAIEFIKEKRKVFEWYDTDLFYLESLLKGDSDD